MVSGERQQWNSRGGKRRPKANMSRLLLWGQRGREKYRDPGATGPAGSQPRSSRSQASSSGYPGSSGSQARSSTDRDDRDYDQDRDRRRDRDRDRDSRRDRDRR